MNRLNIISFVVALLLPTVAMAAPDNVDPQTPLCVTAAHGRLCSTVLRFTVKKLESGDAPILNLLVHKDGAPGQTIASIARNVAQDIVQDITVNWVDRQHEHLLDVLDSGNVIRVLKWTHGQDKALPFLNYPVADSGHYGCVWRAIPSGGSWIYNYLYFAWSNGAMRPFWTSNGASCQLFTHLAADTAAAIGQMGFNEQSYGWNPVLYTQPTGLYNGDGVQSCYLHENKTTGTGFTWSVWVDPTYTPDGIRTYGNWYLTSGYEFQDCAAVTMLAYLGQDGASYAASGISGAVYGATKQ